MSKFAHRYITFRAALPGETRDFAKTDTSAGGSIMRVTYQPPRAPRTHRPCRRCAVSPRRPRRGISRRTRCGHRG